MDAVEIPKTAQQLADFAREHGWTVRITCAQSTGGSHHKGKVVESVAVRMRREDRRLVGLWKDGKFFTGICSSPMLTTQSKPLSELVATTPETFEEISDRVFEAGRDKRIATERAAAEKKATEPKKAAKRADRVMS